MRLPSVPSVLCVVVLAGCGRTDVPSPPSGQNGTGGIKEPAFPAPTGRVAQLVERLGIGDRESRVTAANDLGAMGPAAVSAIPALVEEAVKEDPGTHKHYPSLAAAEALKRIGPEKAVPLVADKLDSVGTRFWAATFLMELEPASLAKPAIPELVEAVRAVADCETDDERWACTRAAAALGRIEPEGMSALVRQLTHDSAEVRTCAVSGVPRNGDGAVAVPALCRLLDDPSNSVRQSAAHALGQIGDQSALQHLERALEAEKDIAVRRNVVAAILQLRR